MELRQVTLRYADSARPVLDRVDLGIAAGELVLLAGPTGAGKSSLLGVIAGLVPAFTGGRLTGEVLLDGESVIDRPARERAHAVGFVGQNPPAWFVTDTVEEELAFGMEQLGLAPATMRRRVEETLDLLGIADLRHRDLRTLSGGQQQRVAIGTVLTTHPRLLVLDEPTSALDPTAAEDVLATITRLVHDLDVSVLVAEHRLERVVPFADRMAVLDGSGALRVGDPATVLRDSPVAPPLVELGRLLGWDPLPLTVREARRHGFNLPGRHGVSAPEGADTMTTRLRKVSVLHHRTPALTDVDLALAGGTITALMGRNGAGKSTLLWTLQGRHVPATGSVRVGGEDPARLKPGQRRTFVGLVPQTPADLLYLETVAEECAAADEAAGAADGSCAKLLDTIAPGIASETHPRDLSEGQRLALAVAIVLTDAPPLLLLDEPTRGLDYAAKGGLADALQRLAGEGRTVLVATHDVEFVALVADRVVVLADGEVVSDGPVRQVVAESPAFAPQTTKVLGPDWLTVAEVADALRAAGDASGGTP